MERRDNTLKFTPIFVNEDKDEVMQQPRYIPIEDVAELYLKLVLYRKQHNK